MPTNILRPIDRSHNPFRTKRQWLAHRLDLGPRRTIPNLLARLLILSLPNDRRDAAPSPESTDATLIPPVSYRHTHVTVTSRDEI